MSLDGRSALEKLIATVTRDTFWFGTFMCTVQAPSSGDTVDLLPDDPRLKGEGLQGVPVSYGLPDCKATIIPGAKVLLFFENGDRTKPRAGLFSGSATEIKLGGNAIMPVARVGDPISVICTTPGTVAVGTIVGGAVKTKAL